MARSSLGRLFQFLIRLGLLAAVLPAVAQTPPEKKPAGERYALVVGVQEYDKNELRNLPYTEADATELASVLVASGYRPENVVLMTQTLGAKKARALPLAENIRRELKLLLANREEGDVVLIALAGHGVQFKNSDEAFFCPMDAKLGDKQTLLSFKELYADLEKCPASFKLVLADACRNDPQSSNARSRAEVDLESVTRPQKLVPPGGVAVFFSCSAGEKAFEANELKHGVFFNYVIAGLRGEAVEKGEKEVTLNALEGYVKRRVGNFVRSEYGVLQTPELVNQVRGLPVLASVRFNELELQAELDAWSRARDSGKAKTIEAGITSVKCDHWKQAALAGSPVGEVLYGHCLLAGLGGVAKDGGQAVSWFQKAAEKGNVVAQYQLGQCYDYDFENCGVTKDIGQAVNWYRKAADQGHASAQTSLGVCYDLGVGVAKDANQAASWFRKAADRGNPTAQNNLALCYEKGIGVGKDAMQAVSWYRKAADQGYAAAQCNLGLCYDLGFGVAKDAMQAASWYRKGADQGNAAAQNNLGLCYEQGFGVAKDVNQAASWYRKAADQGNASAQLLLAKCYDYDYGYLGVTKDINQAVIWYRKAAEQGNAAAQNNLGVCYEGGHGVAKDINQAVAWYRKAAAQGNRLAQENLNKLGR